MTTNLLVFLIAITNWTSTTFEKPVDGSQGWTNQTGIISTQTWAKVWVGSFTNQVMLSDIPSAGKKLKRKVEENPIQPRTWTLTNYSGWWCQTNPAVKVVPFGQTIY